MISKEKYPYIGGSGVASISRPFIKSEAKELQIVKLLDQDNVKKGLEQILPKGIDLKQFLRICIFTIKGNPGLSACEPDSILASIVKAAELRLQPSALSGQAYLVPYKRKCQLIIGYKGLMTLACRASEIESFQSTEVYEGEPFQCILSTDTKEVNPGIKHERRKDYFGKKIIGYYAKCFFKSGHETFEFISQEEMDYIRDQFSTNYYLKNNIDKGIEKIYSGEITEKVTDEEGEEYLKVINKNSIWYKHPVPMAKKTVLKRLCAYLPMEDRVQECLIEEDLYNQKGKIVQSSFSKEISEKVEEILENKSKSRTEELPFMLSDEQPEEDKTIGVSS